ncbi:MAG: DUF2628 domain-containing protein [Hyphomicrobiales bacterium]|nr:DUF2628 domain-containing protein [Hyphomicrobiales bacterium]
MHSPAGQADLASALERARLVKVGFSWAALLFGPLWMLAHRLWRPLALFILGAALVGVLIGQSVVGSETAALLYFLYALYLGFEGRAFLEAALDRRGQPLADIICAADRSTAERMFVERSFVERPARPVPPATGRPPQGPPPPQVLGLFPEASR